MFGITGRTVVWIFWSINTVCCTIFAIVAAISFDNVDKLKDKYAKQSDNRMGACAQNGDALEFQMLGLLAGLGLGIIMAVAYAVYTFIFLFFKWIGSGEMAGRGYHIVQTASIYSSMFMLLDALVLNSASKTVNDGFERFNNISDNAEDRYKLAYAFAYVLVGTFLSMFITFFPARNRLQRKCG